MLIINFLLFILGAIIGSFLNVVIIRMQHEGESILFPGSHCRNCGHYLAWYENIPLASFLILRGRCSTCKTRISRQYPLVEITTAITLYLLVNKFGLQAYTLGYFIFSCALIVIFWIDLSTQIIPDIISLPLIIIGLLFSTINPNLKFLDSLFGCLIGGSIFYLIAISYRLLRNRDGMGGGDIKLLAAIGAFLGWQALPFVIMASSLSGATIGLAAIALNKKDYSSKLPFGPFLTLASLIYLLVSTEINLFLYYSWKI